TVCDPISSFSCERRNGVARQRRKTLIGNISYNFRIIASTLRCLPVPIGICYPLFDIAVKRRGATPRWYPKERQRTEDAPSNRLTGNSVDKTRKGRQPARCRSAPFLLRKSETVSSFGKAKEETVSESAALWDEKFYFPLQSFYNVLY
ncbi:MAG: hypothetical protein IJT71_03750, partial [Oscillospiraceae bacterium]|nr:hypothetical protein [Oscillospiraceae bacterium]